MIGGRLNLALLTHVLMTKKGTDGDVECIVIPIEKNNLFKSDKGNVYLDIIAFDVPNSKYGDTHLVKQSLPKKVREGMSKEDLEAMPILGNLKADLGKQEATPKNASDGGGAIEETDDLPF